MSYTNNHDKNMLLCTFTKKALVDARVEEVIDKFELNNKKIYVLEILNSNDEDDYVITYNVDIKNKNYKEIINDTINLHRKKPTNTLYTINALNKVVEIHNNGELDPSFQVPWPNYRNSLLLTDKQNQLRILKTSLNKIVNVN